MAVVALWAGGERRRWGAASWVWLGVGALVTAVLSGVVLPVGLVGVGAWAAVVALWVKSTRLRWLAAIGVLAGAAALMLHVVPGFVNPRVIERVRFTEDALPFSLYLNFDKTLVGLLLFGWALPRIGTLKEWREMLRAALPRAVVTIGLVGLASWATGYVRWAPKLPEEALLWCAVNLLSTCVAEEAVFRGFVQGGLRRAWGRVRGGRWWALGVAAVLFGLAHAGGGAAYVVLATMAGAGYGWVYERTQRVEASVLTHFALNAVHFFLFTYPAVER